LGFLVTDSPRDLGIALGCVVHDMQLLATALLIRSSLFAPGTKPAVRRGPKRLASEVMLLKSRVLLDFLAGGRDSRDIQIHEFGLSPRPLRPPLDSFREFVSKRSVHLSWKRAQSPLTPWHETHGISLEECAIQVLTMAYEFVSEAMAGGVTLTLPHHQKRFSELQQQYGQLRPASEKGGA
jgi:hypothetical protein